MNISKLGLWSGRAAAVLLFLFWGAFFVDHTSEWFLRGDGRLPPARVLVQHGLHFLMLVGLAIMLKWDKAGSAILLAGTIAFFGSIGMKVFPWIAMLNLIPLVCFGVYWVAGHAPQGNRR